MLVFISVPLFVSDCIILGAQGFPVVSSVPRLLLRHLPFTALFVLPSFAIATVTRGIVQFVFAWFIILLSLIAQTLFFAALYKTQGMVGFSVEALLPGFLWAVAVIVVIWQYATRHTVAARAVLIALVFGTLPLTSAVSSLVGRVHPQKRERSAGPKIHISLDSPRTRSFGGTPLPDFMLLNLAIKVEGLPPETLLSGSGDAVIRISGKQLPQRNSRPATSLNSSMGGYWLTIPVPLSTSNILKSEPAEIQASLDLKLLTDKVQTSVPVSEKDFWVPHLGHCFTYQSIEAVQLGCRIGVRSEPMSLQSREELAPSFDSFSFSNPSLPSGFSPTSDASSGAVNAVNRHATFDFIPRHEIAAFERTLTFESVRLSDYVINR